VINDRRFRFGTGTRPMDWLDKVIADGTVLMVIAALLHLPGGGKGGED
jgi:hypothetical protein